MLLDGHLVLQVARGVFITLRGKAADFDKQYESDQQSAHKDAVSLFERYSKGGDNADLKSFAAKTLPHLQEHLKMAQDLRKK